jgi:hypothetical protein
MNVSVESASAPSTIRDPSGVLANAFHPVSVSSHRMSGAQTSAAPSARAAHRTREVRAACLSR